MPLVPIISAREGQPIACQFQDHYYIDVYKQRMSDHHPFRAQLNERVPASSPLSIMGIATVSSFSFNSSRQVSTTPHSSYLAPSFPSSSLTEKMILGFSLTTENSKSYSQIGYVPTSCLMVVLLVIVLTLISTKGSILPNRSESSLMAALLTLMQSVLGSIGMKLTSVQRMPAS